MRIVGMGQFVDYPDRTLKLPTRKKKKKRKEKLVNHVVGVMTLRKYRQTTFKYFSEFHRYRV